MFREVACPRCGALVRVDAEGGDLENSPEAAQFFQTTELVLPTTVSTDTLAITSSACAEGLGFQASLSPSGAAAPGEAGPGPSSGAGSGPEAPDGLLLHLEGTALDERAGPVAVDLREEAPGAGSPAEPMVEPGEQEHRYSRLMGTLAVYALVLSVACGWLLRDRQRLIARGNRAVALGREQAERSERVTESQPPWRRTETVEPLAGIPENLVVELGESLRVADLVVEPLSLSQGKVTLEHQRIDGTPEVKEGGEGAVFLRLRLRNSSESAIFSPLEEESVRDPDTGLSLSFVELVPGPGRVYLYPLPVNSEWTISGQLFSELRPGEEVETVVATSPDAAERLAPEFLWRLHLRTGASENSGVDVGVRCFLKDIEADARERMP